MHQYRIREGSGGSSGLAKARRVRREAADADEDAAQEEAHQRKDSRHAPDGDVEQEPLMQDEVTQSQEGYETGEERAYAHRDIKPGMSSLS